MKNKKLISAILAAASIAGGVVGAQAADPQYEILNTKINSESQARVANDNLLNSRIDTNKANIQTNANGISDNTIAIQKEAAARRGDIANVNFMAGLEKQERANNDKKLSDRIDAEAKARKDADAMNSFMAGLEKQERENNDAKLDAKIEKETKDREFGEFKLNTKIDAEGQARVENDKILNNKIDVETDARVDADKKLNAKIDSNAAKVQEQLDAQDNKNKAQDESIKANGQAIAANKDAIKANADAIKANKAEADATNTYFNSRIENNTANIDKNKVAIENEVKDRKDADTKLQTNIDAEAAARKDADTKLQTNIDAEAAARKDADTKLQSNIDNEAAARIAGDNVLNSRINQVESDANKGIAKASALAALHPLDYDPDNKFDIAAAGGFYKGENAFALGAFYRPNRNVMLSMGTTLTSGDNAYNVGVTFKIGKSGKHTEAGLTTADLYAMIGAMQDKMDQQQKKIEELEAKQAK